MKFTVEKDKATQMKKIILKFIYEMKSSEWAFSSQESETVVMSSFMKM